MISVNDDFTLSGHGMILGRFGLVEIAGTWSFDAKHQTEGADTLDGAPRFTGRFLAKLVAGKKLTATVAPNAALARSRKLKAVPRAPVPDLSGEWLATVKAGHQTTNEPYTLSVSPTWLNVFDLAGSVTGLALETANGKINIGTDGSAGRSPAGRAKLTSFAAKGSDAAGAPVNLKATRQ